MKGRVWVESTLGKGSTFFLELPKEVAKMKIPRAGIEVEESKLDPTLEKEERTVIVPRTAEKKETILLVEDNQDLQLFISSLLEDDYDLRLASNGAEAWRLLQTGWQPALILSDLMMPIMDGFELLGLLKNTPEFCHIPVIMLTARRDAKVKLRALRIGVDDYLLKPFDEEELKASIINTLGHYHLRKSMVLTEGQEIKDSEVTPSITVDDQLFLEELEKHTPALLKSPSLNIDYLSEKLHLSRRQLQRKIKALTGLTPSAYLKETRLQQARLLLETRQTNSVKATSLAVGIRDINYFSRLFRDRFGKLPSDYIG